MARVSGVENSSSMSCTCSSTKNNLPQEIFEEILLYLDLEDILSCSLVCVGWRNAVNSNRLWEKLCKNKNVPLSCLNSSSEARKLPCTSDQQPTDFMPLCDRRRNFMDYCSLKGNWRAGRFLEDARRLEYVSDIVTDYEFMFTYSSRDRYCFTRYKITNGSIKFEEHFGSPYFGDRDPGLFKLVNGVLVITQKNLMHVFSKDFGYCRKLVTFFDEGLNGSKPVPKDEDLREYADRCPDLMVLERCDHNGKYFVGLLQSSDLIQPGSLIHVWDLESLVKIKEFSVLPDVGPIKDIYFSLRNHVVGVVLVAPNFNTIICTYDLKTTCYSSNVIRTDVLAPFVLFTDNMVILRNESNNEVSLYDLTGGCLATLQTPDVVRYYYFLKDFGNLLVFGGDIIQSLSSSILEELSREVSVVGVFDISKLSHVETFRLPVGKRLIHLHIHMNDLMIISTGKQLLIRDMKTRTFTFELPYGSFIPPSPTCTKMIAQEPDEYWGPKTWVLLNFW